LLSRAETQRAQRSAKKNLTRAKTQRRQENRLPHDYRVVGGRAPKVGALGDAGTVAESSQRAQRKALPSIPDTAPP